MRNLGCEGGGAKGLGIGCSWSGDGRVMVHGHSGSVGGVGGPYGGHGRSVRVKHKGGRCMEQIDVCKVGPCERCRR